MSENSKIEWTDHTFNPWIGCTKVSPGCANCYAEDQNFLHTWNRDGWGKGVPRKRTSEANWKLPLKWNFQASRGGRGIYRAMHNAWMPEHRPRVFCASLADWLDDEVPREWQSDLLRLIEKTPNIDWLLLSKRPENWHGVMANGILDDVQMVDEWISGRPPKNVWIGTSVENQEMADKRIPQLLQIPAKVRFLSCEPLLEKTSIEWTYDYENLHGEVMQYDKIPSGIHWVIAGGESGPNARPMHHDWARSLRDQCDTAGVPFFMNQMGGTRKPFAPIPDDLNIRQFPTP